MGGMTWCNYDTNILCSGIVTGSGAYMDIALPGAKEFSIQITPVSGMSTVYNANDGINWVAWDIGAVSISAIDAFDPCRYVRILNNSAITCSYAMWGWL